jgi:uncharacterized protein YndB with AHSA1/START domain
VPIEFAFRTLTQKMATWWPASHHIGSTPFEEIVVEPFAGGRWFERGANGAECDWGRVLVWEPPKRVVVSWHLQPDWSFSLDMARASEVSFEFFAEGAETTRMEFEHRHIERHGEGWEKLRDAVDSPGGWTGILVEFECTLGGTCKTGSLSMAEREMALAELEGSRQLLLESTKGLSLEQWKFKPSAESWSIADCVEHIGIVEGRILRLIVEKALKMPAEPEKRKSIQVSDPGILNAANNRETKLSAPNAVVPAGRWNDPAELVEAALEGRARTVEFVRRTEEDLRSHFLDHPAFGTLDTYQWVLLISAHMHRHTGQIQEVKSHAGFPRSE